MSKYSKDLVRALENVLKIAEEKLQYAIDRNKEWDIEHYRNDVSFLKNELEIVKDNRNGTKSKI